MREDFISRADQAGVYYLSAARRSGLADAIAKTGLQLATLAMPPHTNLPDELVRIGALLHFPDWYGANLDALFDCLTDPGVLPREGSVLLLTGSDHLQQADAQGFATLLEVLQAAADELRHSKTPLWSLVDHPAPGIARLPQA